MSTIPTDTDIQATQHAVLNGPILSMRVEGDKPYKGTRPIDPDWAKSVLPNVIARVQVTDGPGDPSTRCWSWQGALGSGGYGSVSLPDLERPGKRRNVKVHRLIFVAIAGRDIPEGLVTDHRCRNRRCVNPSHLELVTHRVNTLRGKGSTADHARRTHCPEGHALEGDNLRPSQLQRGWRGCLTCNREKAREHSRERNALISAAHYAAGLPYREYIHRFGRSRKAAEAVIRIYAPRRSA